MSPPQVPSHMTHTPRVMVVVQWTCHSLQTTRLLEVDIKFTVEMPILESVGGSEAAEGAREVEEEGVEVEIDSVILHRNLKESIGLYELTN